MDWDDLLETFAGTLLAAIALLILAPWLARALGRKPGRPFG